MAAIDNRQKELFCHMTDSLKKLQQEFIGKGVAPNSSENLTYKLKSKLKHHFPSKRSISLSSFIPLIVKLDFPWYDG